MINVEWPIWNSPDRGRRKSKKKKNISYNNNTRGRVFFFKNFISIVDRKTVMFLTRFYTLYKRPIGFFVFNSPADVMLMMCRGPVGDKAIQSRLVVLINRSEFRIVRGRSRRTPVLTCPVILSRNGPNDAIVYFVVFERFPTCVPIKQRDFQCKNLPLTIYNNLTFSPCTHSAIAPCVFSIGWSKQCWKSVSRNAFDTFNRLKMRPF